MKFFLNIFLFIFLIGFVSAYSHCVNDNDAEWCCDDGWVICNPLGSPFICGKDAGWCDNYNNPQLSCMYNDPNLCCNLGGHVIDYNSKRCCPPTSPFYIGNGQCLTNPQISNPTWDDGWIIDWENTIADNYYTRMSNCGIFYFGTLANPSSVIHEEGCIGFDYFICSEKRKLINAIDNRGIVLNECGVTCTSDSQCPADEVSDNFCNLNQIMKTTVHHSCSNYGCISSESTEVIETCSLSCEMIEQEEQLYHIFTVFKTDATATCEGCIDNEIVLLDNVYFICRNDNLEAVLDLVEFSDAEQQLLLEQINLLNISIEEQIAIVEKLNLTLESKIELVNTLTDKIDEQIALISVMETTVDEQLAIINSLSLNIESQAQMINELTDNLAIKVLLVSQLTATNQEQADLISAMQLSFSDQADIISQLNNTIKNDAIIISNLNINIEDQAKLISELELSNTEMAELITLLNLNIEEQSIIISELRLTLSEEKLLVSQLTDELEEQNAILELLRKENKLTLENIWEDHKIIIMIIGGFLFLLIITGGRKK